MGGDGRGFTIVTIAAVIVSGIAVYEYYKPPVDNGPVAPVVTTPKPREVQTAGKEPVKPEKGGGLPKELRPTLHIGPWTINGGTGQEANEATQHEWRRNGKENGSFFSPSFNCAVAFEQVEKLICGDRELSALDWDLDRAYAQRVKVLGEPERKRLRAMERDWIKDRNECAFARDVRACTEALYRRRIGEIRGVE